MGKYRPEGWENPYTEEVESIIAQCKKRGIDSSWHGEPGACLDAYEAGADAMLEGLRAEGLQINGKTEVIQKEGVPDWFLDSKGTLVFIPEDD